LKVRLSDRRSKLFCCSRFSQVPVSAFIDAKHLRPLTKLPPSEAMAYASVMPCSFCCNVEAVGVEPRRVRPVGDCRGVVRPVTSKTHKGRGVCTRTSFMIEGDTVGNQGSALALGEADSHHVLRAAKARTLRSLFLRALQKHRAEATSHRMEGLDDLPVKARQGASTSRLTSRQRRLVRVAAVMTQHRRAPAANNL
jgi:hypothetical protein